MDILLESGYKCLKTAAGQLMYKKFIFFIFELDFYLKEHVPISKHWRKYKRIFPARLLRLY